MNVADSEVVASVMRMAGYETCETLDEADAVFLNTCSVRDNAEQKIINRLEALHALRRKGRHLIIGVLGCMAERVKEELIENHHVDVVAGPDAYLSLPDLIAQVELGHKAINVELSVTETYKDVIPQRVCGSHISGFVSIMRGCNNFCHYCIVPYTRGRERSRDVESILNEVRDLKKRGYKEVTLLGQNVNSYGKGLDEPCNFARLLRMVNDIPGDFRIRFMTSHPKDCTHELLDAMAECDKVCKHLHLPVQSGSDRILMAMNRHYDLRHYEELLRYAREKMPGLSITSDIIVGFPGETREDFEKTLELVRRTKYSALFTFIYSRRSGTAAEKLPDPIPAEEKSRWFRELLDTQGAIGSELLKNYVGKTLRVLAEDEGKTPGTLSCRAEDNTIVEVAAPPEMIGEFLQVRITAAMNWALRGERAE